MKGVYLDGLIKLFEKNSDEDEAVAMEKYMRNKFHFFGIKKPLRDELVKQHLSLKGLPEPEDINDLVTEYWNYPAREIQYCIQGMLSKLKKRLLRNHISTLEYMITTNSWWDTVDFIAGDLVGAYFQKFPREIDQWTKKWMNSGNFWLQRTCILYQLKYKDKTDFHRMKSYILPCADSDEFFLQKAIGWALRQYSKTNAGEVEEFIENNNLKPLSVREGMKWIKKVSP